MPVTPSLSIGSKKKLINPEWIRGKPRTGSTADSMSQDSANCKQKQ